MKIYPKMIEMVRSVSALSRKVQEHDPDLARQMRRACTSVPLNMVEGWHGSAGTRIVRFRTAMCEARETHACLDVAVAVGYLSREEVADDLERIDHIVAVAWRLCRTRK